MTSPTTAVEQPAKVPPSSEVEQLTTLLVSAASAAAVVGFLAGLPGIGFEAANHLSAMSQVDAMLQLKVPHGVAHPAVMQQHLSNLRRRAAYLIMAGRRLGTAVARERNTPGSLQQALRREATYVRQHLEAVQHRNVAVKKTVAAAYRYGEELGWWAVRDGRTSPECRAAHGSNFRADQPPKIGYPGTVHNRCRCKPGPPHRGGRTVDEATAGTDRVQVVRAKEAVSLSRTVELVGGKPPYQWKHGWVPLTPGAAAVKAKQKQGHAPSHESAAQTRAFGLRSRQAHGAGGEEVKNVRARVAKEFAQLRQDQAKLNLSPQERSAESAYVEDSTSINHHLRGVYSSGNSDKHATALAGAIDRARLSRPITVYRGISGEHIGDLKPGDVIRDPAFSSTSLEPAIAQEFLDMSKEFSDARHYLMVIHASKGSRALALDNDAQAEVLLSPGQPLRVRSVEGDVVHLEAQ